MTLIGGFGQTVLGPGVLPPSLSAPWGHILGLEKWGRQKRMCLRAPRTEHPLMFEVRLAAGKTKQKWGLMALWL